MTTVLVSDRVLRRPTGGNTTYAQNVYERLPANGVDVLVARTPAGHTASTKAAGAFWEGMVLPFGRAGVSAVHYAADTGALIRTRTPIVATIHGAAAKVLPGIRRPVPERIWLYRARRLSRVSTQLITVSRSSAIDLERWLGLPKETFKVIPHGVDHERFFPISDMEARIRLGRLELPDRFFLYLGNLEPRKNVLSLLDALSYGPLRRAGIPLVVAGRPAWDAAPILSALEDAPLAQYVGALADDEVPAMLSLAEALVFPSLYEGFGLPVLEAMACGTPAVVSDIPALREVTDGAASLVDAREPSKLAAQIARVLTHASLAQELSDAGLKRAKLFNWEDSAAAHAEVFHTVGRARPEGSSV